MGKQQQQTAPTRPVFEKKRTGNSGLHPFPFRSGNASVIPSFGGTAPTVSAPKIAAPQKALPRQESAKQRPPSATHDIATPTFGIANTENMAPARSTRPSGGGRDGDGIAPKWYSVDMALDDTPYRSFKGSVVPSSS
jgi:hypothetical protein